MANIPPYPMNAEPGDFALKDWSIKVHAALTGTATISWSQIDTSGSNLTNLTTRLHSDLQGLQGGAVGDYQHLTTAELASLTGKEATSNKDASGGYVGLTAYKINFKNTANTFTNFFTNTTTAARTYTFPDKDGTVAMLSDISAAGAITVKDEGVSLTTALTSLNFVGAGVVATNVAGDVTVTIGGGGGGGATTGTAVLDFGSAPGTNIATIVVTGQAGILAGSLVTASIQAVATASHNVVEHIVVPLQITASDIVAGTGFTIYGVTSWRLTGTFNVQWSWV